MYDVLELRLCMVCVQLLTVKESAVFGYIGNEDEMEELEYSSLVLPALRDTTDRLLHQVEEKHYLIETVDDYLLMSIIDLMQHDSFGMVNGVSYLERKHTALQGLLEDIHDGIYD